MQDLSFPTSIWTCTTYLPLPWKVAAQTLDHQESSCMLNKRFHIVILSWTPQIKKPVFIYNAVPEDEQQQ